MQKRLAENEKKANMNTTLWKIKNFFRKSYIKGLAQTLSANINVKLFGGVALVSSLNATLIKGNGDNFELGVVSRRVVTSAFVAFVVDQLQTESSVFGDFKYHDSGVGTTAENSADTGIETTDGESRATGTQTESAANAYRSVGTISYTTTKAITEHGLFNDSSAGTLMDRSVFSAINVVNGDSIQFTYTITFTAGG